MPTQAALWSPALPLPLDHPYTRLRTTAERISGQDLSDYKALHRWSVENSDIFWKLVWELSGVIGSPGTRILIDAGKMPGARFFPEAQLNFAENLLWKTGAEDAIVFRGENCAQARISWDELHALVSRLQQAFRRAGIGPGDRIAAMVPNRPETLACMLAASSLGAIWSSCSPDFGVQGVLDRFDQIAPTLFIAVDGYWYNGKRQEIGAKVAEIATSLHAQSCVVIDYLGQAAQVAVGIPGGASLDDFIAEFEPRPLEFTRLPSDHPLYILYSSGTTGAPKCITHSAGGTLLQHLKEHRIHAGLQEGDRLFYFTTCGWMMWNWLATGLASGATLMLYDGSPFAPDATVLFDYAEAERCTHFGTSAKFIDAIRKEDIRPAETHDLSALRVLFSTGSPLSPQGFEHVYAHVKQDLHLASIAGGTDIVSAFVGGVPVRPVRSGEIQGPGLGMAVEVWDEAGNPLAQGKGELVCTRPFPSMPVGFWNDPDGAKYRAAYFERHPGIWAHGDFAEWTPSGGMIIHGRSDATLNPGGVRIGTSEIYNQVEQLPEIAEAVCIGQSWDDDVRVVLFVRLAAGAALDDRLRRTIREKIRTGASPRHMPAKIIAVPDIPRTKSGKITELAVRDIVHRRAVKNVEALANPEALAFFVDLEELAC